MSEPGRPSMILDVHTTAAEVATYYGPTLPRLTLTDGPLVGVPVVYLTTPPAVVAVQDGPARVGDYTRTAQGYEWHETRRRQARHSERRLAA